MSKPILEHEGRKYLRTITSCVDGQSIQVDIYDVLFAFNVTCPAVAHAIKKLLAPGQRGKGPILADLIGADAALSRAIDRQKGKETPKDKGFCVQCEGCKVYMDTKDLKICFGKSYCPACLTPKPKRETSPTTGVPDAPSSFSHPEGGQSFEYEPSCSECKHQTKKEDLTLFGAGLYCSTCLPIVKASYDPREYD